MKKFKVNPDVLEEFKQILEDSTYFKAFIVRGDDGVFEVKKVGSCNPTEISANEALENAGMTLQECVFDSIVPACCSEGCMVEPDGTCSHGNESVLLVMALI